MILIDHLRDFANEMLVPLLTRNLSNVPCCHAPQEPIIFGDGKHFEVVLGNGIASVYKRNMPNPCCLGMSAKDWVATPGLPSHNNTVLRDGKRLERRSLFPISLDGSRPPLMKSQTTRREFLDQATQTTIAASALTALGGVHVFGVERPAAFDWELSAVAAL